MSKNILSKIRSTIETAFYRNNVTKIQTREEAYTLAKNALGTIVTDMPVYEPEKLGLQKDSKILLFNDGAVTGRCAAARKIIGENADEEGYAPLLREAVYQTRYKEMYYAQCYIGLHEDFMVRAHLLVPKGHENILYNWLLNFQNIDDIYQKMYEKAKKVPGEKDIFVFGDPDWKDDAHPLGLTLFDPKNNCAALLGMRYFGEFKKGTLTLAWSIANRNGYAACHGGQKRYELKNGKNHVVGVFGLSGSGKSTITHEKHEGKYNVSILHDDAFIIHTQNGSSIALEPSYFDKTQDYPATSPDNKYLITAQNCGATIDDEGRCVLVTEDIRNGNGRAIKSKLWAKNRVDQFKEPIHSIVWLMKDPVLPPVLKINDPTLATVMGATLATKRTTAERLAKGVDPNALVIEPYANPFRTYALKNDYDKFKELFEKQVDCYIFNTGYFLDQKIPKDMTIDILEKIVENTGHFETFEGIEDIEILKIEGFIPSIKDESYKTSLRDSMKRRIQFIDKQEGMHTLPKEAKEALQKIVDAL